MRNRSTKTRGGTGCHIHVDGVEITGDGGIHVDHFLRDRDLTSGQFVADLDIHGGAAHGTIAVKLTEHTSAWAWFCVRISYFMNLRPFRSNLSTIRNCVSS